MLQPPWSIGFAKSIVKCLLTTYCSVSADTACVQHISGGAKSCYQRGRSMRRFVLSGRKTMKVPSWGCRELLSVASYQMELPRDLVECSCTSPRTTDVMIGCNRAPEQVERPSSGAVGEQASQRQPHFDRVDLDLP